MTFDESISEYLSLDCTLGVFVACLDIALWHWYDCLSWLGLRLSFFLRFIARLVWYIDMPIIIDCSSCFAWYSDFVSPWLFWSLHMHTLTTVYHSAWHVNSLTCILSWSSSEHDVRITIHLYSHSFLCGHDWYILYSTWLYDAWLPSLYMIACRLSMWVALLSPYLQISWSRSFLSSRFSLLQVWDLQYACSLTKPEIRSKV